VITNAGGHIGALTFTLKWQGDADLDLHFYCKTSLVDKDIDKVYYADKYAKDCDSKLDVDMTASS